MFDSTSGKDNKKAILLTIITKFSRCLEDLVQGKSQVFKHQELFGGARINYIFNEVFRNKITKTNPFAVVTENDIRAAIKNANGLNPSLLVSEDAFKLLVKEEISKIVILILERLEQPSLECA